MCTMYAGIVLWQFCPLGKGFKLRIFKKHLVKNETFLEP